MLPDASVAVLDTYNGAIRRYDPRTGQGTTLATGLAEPADALVRDGGLLVVESAAHRLRRVRLQDEVVRGDPQRTPRPVSALAPGPVALQVAFDPPPGRHLDERDGPATRLAVSASPASLLLSGGGVGSGLSRDLVLAAAGEGVLHVAATAASCDVDGEHPACHLTQQDWGIPVCLQPGAPAAPHFVLRGS